MHKIEVQFSQNLARFAVSLFTREWIEITPSDTIFSALHPSPSLRGSGLKFPLAHYFKNPAQCLPLYEGVD